MATIDRNIVEFGLSELHIGLYTEENGVVTMGTPQPIEGAKSLTADVDESENSFYADDRKYWTNYENKGVKGEIEVAKVKDAIKKAFFAYMETAQGGLAMVGGKQKPRVYLTFQFSGDAESRRGILYNVSLGNISREYKTKEESVEPVTEKFSYTCMGDTKTNITLDTLGPNAVGYNTLFTAPAAPALADSDENDITSFTFKDVEGAVGVCNRTARTVAVTVPHGTSLTALVAVFELSAGASCKVGSTVQVSGVTSNNFTNPVQYKVIAADETEATWTVAVSVLPE